LEKGLLKGGKAGVAGRAVKGARSAHRREGARKVRSKETALIEASKKREERKRESPRDPSLERENLGGKTIKGESHLKRERSIHRRSTREKKEKNLIVNLPRERVRKGLTMERRRAVSFPNSISLEEK